MIQESKNRRMSVIPTSSSHLQEMFETQTKEQKQNSQEPRITDEQITFEKHRLYLNQLQKNKVKEKYLQLFKDNKAVKLGNKRFLISKAQNGFTPQMTFKQFVHKQNNLDEQADESWRTICKNTNPNSSLFADDQSMNQRND